MATFKDVHVYILHQWLVTFFSKTQDYLQYASLSLFLQCIYIMYMAKARFLYQTFLHLPSKLLPSGSLPATYDRA